MDIMEIIKIMEIMKVMEIIKIMDIIKIMEIMKIMEITQVMENIQDMLIISNFHLGPVRTQHSWSKPKGAHLDCLHIKRIYLGE